MLNYQRSKRYDIFNTQISDTNLEYSIFWIVGNLESCMGCRLANLKASLER